MKNILNRGFSQLSDDVLVTKVAFIISQLTGNPSFPTTNPTLVALQAALDSLEQALTLPNPQAQKAAVVAARSTIEQMLDDLADNLEQTAGNDPAPLATTGYDPRKETAHTIDTPSIPQNVPLKLTGNSGQAQLLFDPSDRRAKGYQVQTAPDADAGPWTDYDTFSSSRNIVLKGFPRAKDLWARVRAIGPNNTKSGWSDPATILIS